MAESNQQPQHAAAQPKVDVNAPARAPQHAPQGTDGQKAQKDQAGSQSSPGAGHEAPVKDGARTTSVEPTKKQ